MTPQINIIIFKSAWGLLFLIAMVTQILFANKSKRKAGLIANLLVIIPFVVVLGLFYLERYFGSVYMSTPVTWIAGAALVGLGTVGYILSHFYLRSNWSLFASIKEGQKLITNGPYRLVRHPMYSSMTVIVLGSGLLISNYLILLFTPGVFIVYYIRSKKEETLLRVEFPEYIQYTRGTKMLIPGIL
jgi:protein-S-isoprenylcysteine O-methyltransferase Ste14